jgi:cell division septal protein FtsQ
MKLKPQPRPTRAAPPRRRQGAKKVRARRGRGRQARRPGVPIRSRLSRRLPALRRILAAFGAMALAAVLVALVQGPWLRVSEVAWAGDRFAPVAQLEQVLAGERGRSLLAVDTRELGRRLERIPAVADASVAADLLGGLRARVVEREAAFVWETASGVYVGSADGTIFASDRREPGLLSAVEALPVIRDDRFAARLITVGDVIPETLVRNEMRLSDLDPATLGSRATTVTVRLDDEFGFRLVSTEPGWEVALGVYGADPTETVADAEGRLDRQVTAVRTLFASRPEGEIGWVDVRNPGKVYFRAKG